MFTHPEVREDILEEQKDLMGLGFSKQAAMRIAKTNVREFMKEETSRMLAEIFAPQFDAYAGSYCPGLFIGPEEDGNEEIEVIDVADDDDLDEPEDL
jgi:hypothetical protein